MASSGTINGPRGGTQYGPYLRLEWNILSQDIPNNRSRVRLTLILVSTSNLQFSATKTGSLQGSSFSYSGGFSGTGTRTLNTRDVWVDHNSDGSKRQTFSASFNIAVTWTGRHLASISVSGSADLDRIPRASTIDSFSNFSLKPNQSNSFSLRLSRATSSFTHNITLRVNGENIQSWNGQGLPTSLSLSSSSSNRILNILRNSTSMTAQLRVQTRSGSTNIGGVITRNATVSVHSDVSPTIDNISVSEYITDIANDIGVFVQNKSRLRIALSTSAGYGARDGSFRITYDGTNYTSKTSTTSIVRNSGRRTISVQYTNSRGQRVTSSQQITVHQYSNPEPRITAVYRSDENGNADEEGSFATVEFNGVISSLDGRNDQDYRIRHRRSDVSHYQEESVGRSGRYTFPANVDYSYSVQYVASDYFTSIPAYADILPTFSLMNLAANQRGIAFGGAYDESLGGVIQTYQGVWFLGGIEPVLLEDGVDLNDITYAGFYRCNTNARAGTIQNTPLIESFSLLVERHAGVKQTLTRHHNSNPRTFIRNYYNNTWGQWFEIQFK